MLMGSLASYALGEQGHRLVAGLLCALGEPVWPVFLRAATEHGTAVAAEVC